MITMLRQNDKQQPDNALSEKGAQGSSLFLQERIQMHRDYISRQWQYFATDIVLNSLLINAVKDLSTARPLLLAMLGIASIVTSGVFFHLINWTNMRINRNAGKINELAEENLVELPSAFEGITPVLLVSTTFFAACWLFWLLPVSLLASLTGGVFFLLIAIYSFTSTRRWLKHASA